MMEIHSYQSVGPIKFGMSIAQVHSTIGEPTSTSKNRSNDHVLRYAGLNITVSSSGVAEVVLLPETPSSLAGINIFSSPSAFRELCRMDGAPREFVGFIFLARLGIAMTGFHDHDESQKAVTAFISGRMDGLLPKTRPFLFSV